MTVLISGVHGQKSSQSLTALRNVSRVRLHMNKPAGTRGPTPTAAYFDIVPVHTMRTKSQRACLVNFRNTLIFASTRSAYAQTRFCSTNNRLIISFLRVQIN